MCGLQWYSNLWRGVASIIGFCVCVIYVIFWLLYNCIILGMLISPGFDPFFLGRGFDSPLLRKIFSTSTYPGNWEPSTEGHVFKCLWCWWNWDLSGKGQLEETCSYVAQCTLRHKLGRCKLSSLLATYQFRLYKERCTLSKSDYTLCYLAWKVVSIYRTNCGTTTKRLRPRP